MATYFTDFSPYTTGAAPTGWTERYDTTGSWQVVAGAGLNGSNGLQYVPGTAARHGLSWDTVDADPGRNEIEIWYRFQSSVGGAGTANDNRVFGRASGADSATANCVIAGPVNTVLRTTSIVAGTGTDTNAAGGTLVALAWYQARVRMSGGTVTTRIWADTSTEPTSWAQTVSGVPVTGVGWAGAYLSVLASTRMTYDAIGIGTAGATAPSSAPAVTVAAGSDVTTQPNAAVTLTGTATSTGTITTRRWDQQSGPSLGTNPLSTTATLAFTPTVAGKYVLRFTATDSLGGSGQDEVTVFVTSTTESRPSATISAGTWTAVGAASLHAATADESATTYAESVDNPAGAAMMLDLDPAPAGNKTLSYSLQDSAATPAGTYLMELIQQPAGTVVASWNETIATTTVLSQDRVLTATENARISDPNNLAVRITGTV
jgi:hypothetical protein